MREGGSEGAVMVVVVCVWGGESECNTTLPLIRAAYLVGSSVAATSSDNRPPNGGGAFTGRNHLM